MATKLRKFSRSRGIKVLLVLLYIACFASMGAIAGYLPAYGYMDGSIYIADVIISDNYIDSQCFADMFVSDYFDKSNSLFFAKDGNYTSANVEFDKSPLYIKYDYQGVRYKNYTNSFYSITVNSSGITTGNGDIPAMLERYPLDFGRFSNDDYFTVGYTSADLEKHESWWLEARRNMYICLASEIVLLVAGIVLLCMICSVSGEDSEGNVSISPLLRLPFEITLLLAVIIAVPLGFIISGALNELCYSHAGKNLVMAVAGGLCAAAALMLLASCATVAVRGKVGRIYRGSIIMLVLHYAWKALKWCGKVILKLLKQAARFPRFIKEIFTGELYKSDTVARKLLFIDFIFIAATVINLVLTIAMELIAPAFVIEIIILGFFLFGRYLLIRDEALLERQIRETYYGNYSFKPEMHKNSPYVASSDMLSAISEQYRRGIEETVKAERTKMELVTNVSHDLKTPLTSIIGYIELLSKQNLEGEAGEYVDILQKKSERLKNIVSDVFELAKTTSGEITVEREPIDLTKLSYQTLGEMEDRIAASGLDIKVNICQPPVTVISDGKRLYRVIQNLLDNALKYSLKGTRIYYSLETHGNIAYIIIKNVASYEMNFTKEEILERFTRGDKSRSTEGTGLGLSIAQGFALACGGTFDIELDGDMFKAIVGFPMAVRSTDVQSAPEQETIAAGEA